MIAAMTQPDGLRLPYSTKASEALTSADATHAALTLGECGDQPGTKPPRKELIS